MKAAMYFWIYIISIPLIFGMRTYYMDTKCSETIDMTVDGIYSGNLKLTSNPQYAPNFTCQVDIKAAENRRIMYYFSYLETEERRDVLKVYSGHPGSWTRRSWSSGEDRPIWTNTPDSGNYLQLVFESNEETEMRGFSIVFTQFYKGDCDGHECLSGACIDDSLECDGERNCDNSIADDELCLLDPFEIAGIAVGSGVAFAIICCVVRCIYKSIKESREENALTAAKYSVPQQSSQQNEDSNEANPSNEVSLGIDKEVDEKDG